MVIFPVDERRFGEFADFWRDVQYVHSLVEEYTSASTGALFSMSHSSGVEAFNRMFADAVGDEDRLKTVCHALNKEVACDLAVSNLGSYVNDHVSVFSESPVSIREMYCTDPLNSNPCISPGLVMHMVYWRGEIFVEIGANRSVFGASYLHRYKDIYLKFVLSTLN